MELKTIVKVAEHKGNIVYYDFTDRYYHNFIIIKDNILYTGKSVKDVCSEFDNNKPSWRNTGYYAYRNNETNNITDGMQIHLDDILLKVTIETYDFVNYVDNPDREYFVKLYSVASKMENRLPDVTKILEKKIDKNCKTHSYQRVGRDVIIGLNNETKEIEYSVDGKIFYPETPHKLIDRMKIDIIDNYKNAGYLFVNNLRYEEVDNPYKADWSRMYIIKPSDREKYNKIIMEYSIEQHNRRKRNQTYLETLKEFMVENPHKNE